MKKLISCILCIGMLSGIGTAYAENPVKILLNGEAVQADVSPFIENDRHMVPVRAIFEAMGANVQWDGETGTVLMLRQKDGVATSVILQINNDKAFVNGEQVIMDTPAKIVSDRTFVPLRFIVESFDEDIDWDGETGTVYIVTK